MVDTPFGHTVIAGLQERIKALAPARLGAHGLVPDHASPGLDGRQALCPRATDQRWRHRWQWRQPRTDPGGLSAALGR